MHIDRIASSSKVSISHGDHEVYTKTSAGAAFTSPSSRSRIQKCVKLVFFASWGPSDGHCHYAS